MKRLICLAICAVCLSALPAYANSAPSYWEGFPYSDVLCLQQDSPITVESERLTFDFSEDREGDNWTPVARVLADYRMTNPTQSTLSVQMAFPFVARLSTLSVPDIAVSADGAAVPYDIYIDPDAVYSAGSSPTGVLRFEPGSIGNISDQEWTLPGFGTKPKAKIYRYTVSAKEEDRLDLEIGFDADPERTVLIAKDFHGSSSSETDGETLSVRILGETKTEVAILGQELPLTCRVLTQEGKAADKNIYRLEVAEESVDLGNYLLAALRENLNKETAAAISDTQLLNLCLHAIERERRSMGHADLSEVISLPDERIFTLVYRVDFPPGASRNVSVGYIADGTMDRRETQSPKYSYTYLLSPADNWADFGSLDVEIITPQEAPYIIESSLELRQSGQNRYSARFKGLPDSELTFVLYEDKAVTFIDKAKKDLYGISYFLIFFRPVLIIILAIISLLAVRSVIRRNHNGKPH
jgi:hypothetical protein